MPKPCIAAGVFTLGKNAKEFGYMVETGMPPMEAIRSATVVAAEVLGWDDQLGTIATGKIADIIAVKDDPLMDIQTLKNVVFVMKAGKVYKQ